MTHDMVYDGQTLDWPGHGKFRATSGLAGLQSPSEFCMKDNGPVPPGLYKLFLADQSAAQDDGRGACALKPAWGRQAVARGAAAGEYEPYWVNWDTRWARMAPADVATRNRCAPIRGGFYLHDFTKGFNHGCIEVEARIFPLLRTYARSSQRPAMIIKVEYVADRNGR